MRVEIFFDTAATGAVKRAAPLFKSAVQSALRAARTKRRVCLIFSGDRAIKELNKKFLGRNRVTDVLVFGYPPRTGFKTSPVYGDIYVCLSQAARQAADMGHSLITEVLILSVHGALHLAGMDDATLAQRKKMNAKTALLLRTLGVRGFRRGGTGPLSKP